LLTFHYFIVDVLPVPDSFLRLLNTRNEAIQHFRDTVASFYILVVMKIAYALLFRIACTNELCTTRWRTYVKV